MEDFAVNVSDLRLQLKCARANVVAIQLAMAEQGVDKLFNDALYAASEHLEMLTERLDAIRNKIAGLVIRMEAGGSTLSATPVSGGHALLEGKYVNSLALKGKYETQLKSNILEYKAITRAIKSLSRQDQRILDLAYINRGKLHIDNIKTEFNVERSQAYRYKDMALANFVLAMYGR